MSKEEKALWNALRGELIRSRPSWEKIKERYLVMADWFEERREYNLAFMLRWCAEKEKYPTYYHFKIQNRPRYSDFRFRGQYGRNGKHTLPNFIWCVLPMPISRKMIDLFYGLSKTLAFIRKGLKCNTEFFFHMDGD